MPSCTILNLLRVREKCMTLPRRGGTVGTSADGADAVTSCDGSCICVCGLESGTLPSIFGTCKVYNAAMLLCSAVHRSTSRMARASKCEFRKELCVRRHFQNRNSACTFHNFNLTPPKRRLKSTHTERSSRSSQQPRSVA